MWLQDTVRKLAAGQWRPRQLAGPLVVALAFGVPGCARLLPTPEPLREIRDVRPDSPHQRLMVFLPGIGDRPQDFIDNGFFRQLREAGETADLVAVDTHIGYYAKRIMSQRLRDDIIRPAKAAGYQEIWLVGISLGGFGALVYEYFQPDEVDGIVMLAPYLGEPELLDEITSAGLAQWQPGTFDENSRDGFPRALWGKLKQEPLPLPETWLLYGHEDRFAKGHQLLASRLPNTRVISQRGGHEWATWQQLWDAWLEQKGLAK